MGERRSKRQASRKATALIKTMSVSKPKLPKGMLNAQETSHTKRLAKAVYAERLSWVIGSAQDPIESFNKRDDSEKGLLMEHLLLSYCKFYHEHGANLAPADSRYFSETGLPSADWALMRGSQLFVADDDANEELQMPQPERSDETIHGEPCWPPSSITGICSSPVTVDNAGRVNLQHDPYCLRRHFTTQWGVLKDPHNGRPQLGHAVRWSDSDWYFEVEGEHPGLQVNLSNPLCIGGRKEVDLSDLISSPLLLYRITANFGAPPSTNDDDNKCAWTFVIWNRDDPTCSLEIRDHKGWPMAVFYGGTEASTAALQLFDWLTGGNCPHSY
ncbi:hypothetical protein F5883DRAFT_593327, partial [Diaporthe sp. PMI_573]